jgi:hypothetical protein
LIKLIKEDLIFLFMSALLKSLEDRLILNAEVRLGYTSLGDFYTSTFVPHPPVNPHDYPVAQDHTIYDSLVRLSAELSSSRQYPPFSNPLNKIDSLLKEGVSGLIRRNADGICFTLKKNQSHKPVVLASATGRTIEEAYFSLLNSLP